jgi:hypothetical protein
MNAQLDYFRKKPCKRRSGKCRPRTSPEAAEKYLGHHEIFKREGEMKVS